MQLPNFLKNKRRRQIIVLTGLLLFLFTRVSCLYFKSEGKELGPLRTVMCSKCGFIEQRRVLGDISNYKCSKCGGKIGYLYKCSECDYEFPYFPPHLSEKLNSKQIQNRLKVARKCPNCGSFKTHAVSLSKKRKSK